MAQTLKRFWRALELLVGQATVNDEWRLCLGPEFPVAARFLRPTNEIGCCYPRSDLLDPFAFRRPYRVVSHGPDDHVGLCPDGDPPIRLSTEQLIVYELHRPQFFRQLAEAFGFDPDEAVIDRACRIYQVGWSTPTAGYRFPVFLAFPQGRPGFRRAVDAVSALADTPFLLFAPTRASWHRAAEDVLRRNRGCFLPIAETVVCNEAGRLSASEEGNLLLERFSNSHVPRCSEDPVREFFPTPPNATWADIRIRFLDGERVSVKVGEASGTYNYAQMGMVRRTSGEPTEQWKLLRAFAAEHGFLDWSSRHANRRNQKRKERLSAGLVQFFRIEGDPIVTEGNGWRTRFAIEPDA